VGADGTTRTLASRMSTRRRRLILAAVAAVAVVLLAEGGARILAPYLAEPQRYGDDATAVKVAQMDARGDACTDLVLAGNSMGRDAFDPSAFQAADAEHRSAYNASLDAASPELLEQWVAGEVAPRLAPSTVVLTLASLDVNEAGPATRAALEAYEGAEQTRSDLMGRLGAAAGSISDLVSYRTQLRDPTELQAAFERLRTRTAAVRPSPAGIDHVIGPDGEGLSRRALHYGGEAGAKLFTREQLLKGWHLDDDQVAAATSLIAELRANGTEVVLVVLPVTDDYIDQHPNGATDFDAFLGAAHGIAETTGAPLIDLHDAGATELFADTHHLNGDGTAWFSVELASRLDALGLDGPARCGA
jgi:hypothetical protein